MLNHVHSHRLFLFILHPAFYFSPITPGENKINVLFHSLIMAALFLSSAWTSVYLQGLFFNRTVRVYKVKEFPLPSLLGYCWNGCKMGGETHRLLQMWPLPAHPNRKMAAPGNDWVQGTGDISVSFNYLKTQVTYPAFFCVSPLGNFLRVLANAQESDV